ncbi:ketose-bisphosphate aldolase [Lipomyces kononenkoae]
MLGLETNKALQMIKAAEEGGYGFPGVVSYNIETIVAAVRAAEAKRSPVQILLFPWAIDYSDGLLVKAAAAAAHSASVPITVHLDHAQDEDIIKKAADAGGFDSIMIDMSHFEKEENLSKTAKLVQYCHDRGIATEAEPGRMEGGEDGVQDTGNLEGLLTTPEEANRFITTGIDFLAPAFGNLHGHYGAVENIKLDFDRLDRIRHSTKGRVHLVLHGTNDFPDGIMQGCVKYGMTRCNVNDLAIYKYNRYIAENAGKVPLTTLMEDGTKLIQECIEHQMDVMGGTGKV